jgi:hypothetical protein
MARTVSRRRLGTARLSSRCHSRSGSASSARPPSAKGKSTGPLNAEEGAQAAARG